MAVTMHFPRYSQGEQGATNKIDQAIGEWGHGLLTFWAWVVKGNRRFPSGITEEKQKQKRVLRSLSPQTKTCLWGPVRSG
jgi:hypothetical protein